MTISITDYIWQPYLVGGEPPTFLEMKAKKPTGANFTYYTNAIYKWQGPLTTGPLAGMIGLYVGQTSAIGRRIENYRTGGDKNEEMRRTFLTLGPVRLFLLVADPLVLEVADQLVPMALQTEEDRLTLEKLVILIERRLAGPNVHVFNEVIKS